MILWRDEMSVGCPTIDDDHKALIDIINEFERCQTRQSAEKTCKKLYRYTQVHFQREESIHDAFRYNDSLAQKKEHDEILRNLRAIIRDSFLDPGMVNKDALLIQSLTQLMRDWIVGHVLHTDLKMRSFFKARRDERMDSRATQLPPIAQQMQSAVG